MANYWPWRNHLHVSPGNQSFLWVLRTAHLHSVQLSSSISHPIQRLVWLSPLHSHWTDWLHRERPFLHLAGPRSHPIPQIPPGLYKRLLQTSHSILPTPRSLPLISSSHSLTTILWTTVSHQAVTLTVSVKNRTLIQDEWRHILWLFLDEVSLIGAQLLTQIDHALRYAKEKEDKWFGGINIIFAGDFYQYPLVGSTPLYTLIQPKAPQHAADIEKWLGCLAWKSIDMVISLSEQQRMKEDPEFAAAVGRLWIRECNLGDVELFNKWVVKLTRHPNGLELYGELQTATMLVGTNFVQELLNNSKAKSSCTGELIYCAAHDMVNGTEPTTDEQQQLLGLNLADFSSEGALPGFIPLFIGMPVILRNCNISTELGITNGSQGIVRKIFTEPCANNYSVAKCIFVEFPDSTVEIPGLPLGCFPLTPTTWKFSVTLKDSTDTKQNVHVSRSQLNLQPAFAITGHAARGKTLPHVVVDLAEGGLLHMLLHQELKPVKGSL